MCEEIKYQEYCIIWKESPLPKVRTPLKVSPPLQCISNGQVCHRDILFESKPPGLLSRLLKYSVPDAFLYLQEFPKADFSAAIFTYHFGYDNVGWPSLERTAQLFSKMGESNVYNSTIEWFRAKTLE